jgi:hypothetical protein
MRLVQQLAIDYALKYYAECKRKGFENDKERLFCEDVVLAIRDFRTEAISYEGFYYGNQEADLIEKAALLYCENYCLAKK